MAEFTVTVDSLQKNNFDFGLVDYEIFDETYRQPLNTKILKHYRFSEIGFETEELFRHYLNTTMEEIMPYYNQMYKSELIEFNPLYNVDLTEQQKKDYNVDNNTNQDYNSTVSNDSEYDETTHTTGTDHSDGTSEINSKQVYSDTPQGLLQIGDIEGNVYATNATFSVESGETTEDSTLARDGQVGSTTTNTGEQTASTEIKNTVESLETYINTKVGANGAVTPMDALIRFRETFLNIDSMVIEELRNCFMLVWQ